MLPDGNAVKSIWNDVIKFINNNTIIVDCSTIDINVAQDLHKICKTKI